MTMFFASPRLAAKSPVSDALISGQPLEAANDNTSAMAHEALLHSALKHFAEHGLAAARVAGDNSRDALARGETEQGRYWLSICRALDRRMAAGIALKLGVSL